MLNRLDPPLGPRDLVSLNVLAVCRISTAQQDPKSLGDQEALLRHFVEQSHTGPTRWKVIASQGSGEHLDRNELTEIEERFFSKG